MHGDPLAAPGSVRRSESRRERPSPDARPRTESTIRPAVPDHHHSTSPRRGASLRTAMVPRSPHEHRRAATPLELLFDLVFVVAIAQAGQGLHHAIAESHPLDGLASYAMVFFAIWWAWMNFTWFASAYDCDDVPYRLAVFVQITGALVMAAGISVMFEEGDYRAVTLGYV